MGTWGLVVLQYPSIFCAILQCFLFQDAVLQYHPGLQYLAILGYGIR